MLNTCVFQPPSFFSHPLPGTFGIQVAKLRSLLPSLAKDLGVRALDYVTVQNQVGSSHMCVSLCTAVWAAHWAAHYLLQATATSMLHAHDSLRDISYESGTSLTLSQP